ncbi:c-type cytochrome [Methylocystis parvus]|uniref:Cytochrome c n=1 Tax=Methylocystis parvus TaxID=134 RepID=A0A6B8M4G6_9HYPH|nr:cytochrome c [Methylocystis parvus]QGM97781.1 cytochrome c [Methylocystis parvus]WBK01914.1 cytochrome c [Methylocystis parvus OBBP]
MLKLSSRAHLVGVALLICGLAAATAEAQSPQPASPPAAPPSAAKQAVENRKAAYTLIGNYFRWFGGVAKGTIPYDEAEATKRAMRIALLSGIVEDAFPDGSNAGEPESKAKPDVWSNRADFDKKLKDFQAHAQALVDANAKEKGSTEAFKAAVATLAGDCKGCHETYKVK